MELGYLAFLISLVVLVYACAALFILTRYMYRSIFNIPSRACRFDVCLRNDLKVDKFA